jgi:hypothetical protein
MAGAAVAAILALMTLACDRDLALNLDAAAGPPAVTDAATDTHEGLIYGRVTTENGAIYEGRLRWGHQEEALWGNDFNGFKNTNPWAAYVDPERLPRERASMKILGIEFDAGEIRAGLGRPFMARFGDIARIDPRGRDLQVTLKSGTAFHLDRYGADDLADGLQVWDARLGGAVRLNEWWIRSVELLAAVSRGAAPDPLYGTVRTTDGDFTGFVEWDREQCLASDEVKGRTASRLVSMRFDGIRAIARVSRDRSRLTLTDGSEIELAGTRDVGDGNRGVYVDDARYGRVLVSWDAFERVDFSRGGTGPAYGDYRAGRALAGTVTTRSGRRLAGRLVYDLDESETTETLDAPSHGIHYTIPFDRVRSIALPRLDQPQPSASVLLRSGEDLHLELADDLGERNGGMLVFVHDRQAPEYVPWTDVERIDFD